mgnify:CR=1 FL=1
MTARRFALPVAAGLLGACSLISNDPPTEVAEAHMSRIVGKVWNTKISNCSGDDNRKTCAVSYNRSFGATQYYEELSMDFQNTPNGWSVLGYKVIKTNRL